MKEETFQMEGQTESNGGTNEVFSDVKDRIGSDGGCFDRKNDIK